MTSTEGILLAAGGVAVLALVPRPARPARPGRPGRRTIDVRSNANWQRRWRVRGRRTPRAGSDLAAVERLLSLSISSADDEHTRLRPLVTGIARQRLADHTGVRLDGDPQAAAAAVGPELWELVRPDRPRPLDRRERGIPAARLRRVVESLERIGGPE